MLMLRHQNTDLPSTGYIKTCLGVLLGSMALGSVHAHNLPSDTVPPPDLEPGQVMVEEPFDSSGHLLGSMGGLRDWLHRRGITLNIQTDDELWVNTHGGNHEHGTYDGVGTVQLTIDMEKFARLHGGLFNVSWLNIRGRSVTEDQLHDYNPISGYEAYRSNRLFELWYQQSFLEDHRLDVKIGQQALDNEFLISEYANLFINSNFGWPVAPSINLYAGGPSWPLASLGVRFRYRPDDQTTLMFAAMDDNPTGHSFYNEDDPSNQSVYPHGDNFNLGNGTLLISELQYAINPQPDDLTGLRVDPGLPGTYKIGAMYDTAHFPDQRYDKNGKSLADPDSSGIPKQHKGNWIFYAVMDQMVWRPAIDSPQSLGVFARVTSNRSDRNPVSLAIDAGVTLKAPFANRENDTVGIGWGVSHTGSRARDADRDSRRYADGYYPVRHDEQHIEITYQAQVTPWLVVQPDFQFIRRPGGGVLNEQSGHKFGSETVFGLHTRIIF